VSSRSLARTIVPPVKLIDVLLVRIRRELFLLLRARVVVWLDDFGEIGLTLWTYYAMLIPVPLVLALMTVDELSLLRPLGGLCVGHGGSFGLFGGMNV
jgi:hypothetical protein